MASWLGTDNPLDPDDIEFSQAWITNDRQARAIVSMAKGGHDNPRLQFTCDSSDIAQRLANAFQKAASELRELEQQIGAEGPAPDPAELAEFRAWKKYQADESGEPE